MKKRILSLLCVLALCLGLLPVTALAADAPNTLWVGETQITGSGYWTTGDNGKLTASDENNYNVYYDGSGTLTLKDATIQGRGIINEAFPIDYGIYAASTSGQSVALTINLIGSNTVNGYGGICVEASGGDSTLVIHSSGNDPKASLEAIGSGRNGITMSSNSGNVSLTINNASVEASTKRTGYYGVSVTSNAGSPTISLTVNGGSLTAQGDSGLSGIRYFFRTNASNPSISLTVQNNAWVKAMPGIATSASMASKPTTQGNGIVFDGTEGTVYGNVKLDEPLTVGEGETLTIPEGSTLDTNGNLTNNGTIVNKGTLNGDPTGGSGTVVNAPAITTDSLPEGTVDQSYNAELEATGNNITWSASGLPNGLALDPTNGTISGTPTMAGTSTFTVKAENSAGSDSKEYTLTIQSAAVPVTGVKLNTNTLELFTSQSETLTATVTPNDATNPNVTWSSDNEAVAMVDNSGKVTAVTAGEANITVETEDGNHTANCKVTVTQSTYSISADTTALNFGSVYTGYAQPAAQTVTVENTGNQTLTLTHPASTGSFEVGSLSKSELTAGEKATFTVQPKAGLAVGTYSENITVTGTNIAPLSITVTFTVMRYSSGGSSTPTKTPSQQATDKIESAKEGSTVEITLRTGQTKLDKEVFEALAGRDVTLEISLPGGVSWTVNGQDIPENTDLTDLDLGVTLDASTIPVSVVNTITGAVDTIQISLKHDGEFGFTMTLSAPLGKTNAGYWANLYYYNEDSRALEFQSADKIASDGTAEFAFSHASDYAIVIDTDSHEPVELPFTDVPEGYWAYGAIQYVYGEGLMAGTSGSTFNPEGTTTRGQIVTILWRLSGSPVVNYLMDFDDVDPAAYYGEAIRWATSEGIAGGYGGGVFGPDDPITREQLAVMLHRYAQHEGYDVSIGEDTNILSYADAFTVSEYAVSALQWACGAGIISGTGDGSTLTPQGEATRAQAATVLMRFCEEYVTL